MTQPSVTIPITPASMPSTPSRMGEVAAFAQVLTHTGILKKIQEQVRFARARFGKSRPHRFRRGPDRLCSVRRANPAGFLRTTCLVGLAIHGPLWSKPLAPSLNPFSFSCGPRSEHCRSPACALSRGWAFAQPVCVPRRFIRSDGKTIQSCRCGWHSASYSSTRVAANGRLASSPSPGGIRSALQAIRAASGERWFARGR